MVYKNFPPYLYIICLIASVKFQVKSVIAFRINVPKKYLQNVLLRKTPLVNCVFYVLSRTIKTLFQIRHVVKLFASKNPFYVLRSLICLISSKSNCWIDITTIRILAINNTITCWIVQMSRFSINTMFYVFCRLSLIVIYC